MAERAKVIPCEDGNGAQARATPTALALPPADGSAGGTRSLEIFIKLAPDVAVYAAGRAVPVVGSMAFTLLCVHVLPAAEYARYSLSVLPALIAASFVSGLAGQPLLRFGLHLDAERRRKALWNLPLAAAALALLVIAAWSVWRGGSFLLAAVALPLVPLLALNDTRRCFLVAHSKPGGVFWLDTCRTAVSLLLLLLLWLPILLTRSAPTALAPLAAMSLGALATLLLVRPTVAGAVQSPHVSVDRRYLQFGIWTAGWLAIATLIPLAERLFMEHTRGIEAAGGYAALSDPLTAAVLAGSSVIGNSVWPKFIMAWNRHDAPLVRRLIALGSLGTAAMGGMVGFIGIGVAGLSRGRLASLLAHEPVLGVAMLAVTTLWALVVFVHKPLELAGRTQTMFMCLLVSLLGFIALAFALVRPFGGLGVVAAKGASGLIYLLLVSTVGRFLAFTSAQDRHGKSR